MKKSLNYTLILGSKSSRRRQILEEAGLDFKLTSIECDEAFPEELDIQNIARYLAEKKSRAYSKTLTKNQILLTADTIVVINDQILGKPDDDEGAKAMLTLLSGKTHEVITGVCLRSNSKTVSFQDTTTVSFQNISLEEIEYYIEKDKPFDKAGSYGIQDWIGLIGVASINGSYYNVVGLPIHRVYEELKNF